MSEAPKNVEGAYLTDPDPIASFALDLLRGYVKTNAVTSADACRYMEKLDAEFYLEPSDGE